MSDTCVTLHRRGPVGWIEIAAIRVAVVRWWRDGDVDRWTLRALPAAPRFLNSLDGRVFSDPSDSCRAVELAAFWSAAR